MSRYLVTGRFTVEVLVKDEIAGPERVAVEVYPRAKDVIDQANMRHLFVLPEGQSAPFTIAGRWE